MRRKSRTLRTTMTTRRKKMKGTLTRHLQVQLGQVSLAPLHLHRSSSSAAASTAACFQDLPESEAPPTVNASDALPSPSPNFEDRDFILSQDFFCTPDYITPDNQNLLNGVDSNQECIPCPKSPEKINTVKTKRKIHESVLVHPLSPSLSGCEQVVELGNDTFGSDDVDMEKETMAMPKKQNYVSQSAVALRCRVMPPPCMKNPYLKDASDVGVDPFGNQRTKCAGFFPALFSGDGLSRYHTDFHEIKQIGTGNFSRVFKVLKRIDGCLYAVKQSTRPLNQDIERRRALMEVQALAALGSHENIVGYYSSWFENEQLYIQMELCDCSLSIGRYSHPFFEVDALRALYQIAKALLFVHEKGVAHLDVKPDNIYVKDGVFKLGDFGCVTLLDKSLPIEEGDARYMPQEILNERYDYLDKVDIFSLGAAIYEIVRGSTLPEMHFMNLKEGKLPLLPGHSLQFQNLIKAMVDPDPTRRPSAREVLENPIFDKVRNHK
ncbi:wee1-like protein kinase [Benincasa hispida]|uniref:wee1-like protein kinase n=1 Tax=Benincasa hispida TaxID=102211 RepID=UPI0019017F46|nr:wee1-like protein kinase [Benincasa hispida]